MDHGISKERSSLKTRSHERCKVDPGKAVVSRVIIRFMGIITPGTHTGKAIYRGCYNSRYI